MAVGICTGSWQGLVEKGEHCFRHLLALRLHKVHTSPARAKGLQVKTSKELKQNVRG